LAIYIDGGWCSPLFSNRQWQDNEFVTLRSSPVCRSLAAAVGEIKEIEEIAILEDPGGVLGAKLASLLRVFGPTAWLVQRPNS
jgi:hypothetical protein